MKVFVGEKVWADGSRINLPEPIGELFWDQPDAWPFLYSQENFFLVEPDKDEDGSSLCHTDLWVKAGKSLGKCSSLIAGRYWANSKLLSFYRMSDIL